MHHLQSSLDRLFEPREIYGIPMSNLIIVLTICFSVLRNGCFRLVRPLSARLTNHLGTALKEGEFRARHDHVTRKGQKYLYHLLWFLIVVPWEIRLGLNATWFRFSYDYSNIEATIREAGYGMKFVKDSAGNSVSIAYDPRNEPWHQEFHLFLIIQVAWYVHCFIEETVWDRMRGDYWLMVVHHIVTIMLLVFVVQLGFEVGGMYSLFVMDIVDLLLYTCKTCHLYTSTVDGTPRSEWCVTIQRILLTFILSAWILLRVIYFNSIVLASYNVYIGSGSYDNVFMRNPDYLAIMPKGFMPYPFLAFFVFVLIVVIAVLQTAWTLLIFRVWYRLLRSGRIRDEVFQTHAQPNMPSAKEESASVMMQRKQK